MTHASIYAFGETEKADHTQVHHRQVLQSIHSLHSADKNFSQESMNELMEGADESVHITTKLERQQRWLVNQRNSTSTLAMYAKKTKDGVPSLIAWALSFANKNRSAWKRRVGKEIATWLSMDAILLGLHFESELGSYFEEITAWHNRKGPINDRSGFRMMELFDLYLGFEVPWWNEAVANPASKMPKTMKFLEDNFDGEEYVFRRGQIMRGLKKGRDELIKMTTQYLLRPPLLFLLLCNRKHGAPFLRALLSILHEHHVDDLFSILLINEPDSSDWGKYVHNNRNECPSDERQWYDLMSSHHEDVVHWWRQFRMNHPCLLRDLQRLSKSTCSKHPEEKAPLLAFKADFPILFECLHAVFGLMMSHSRLCESIHGMMRHGLRIGTGMDQVDAQRAHMISTEYELREQRRNILLCDGDDGERAKKRMKSIEHNKTKGQVDMMGVQLVDAVEQFDRNMRDLLATPGHGIPSIRLINALGRRHQDKKNLAAQMEAENKMAAGNSREQLTVDMVRLDAGNTALSNDRVMRLGEERLAQRIRIKEMSTQKFWKELFIPEGIDKPGQYIMWTACKHFTHLSRAVWRKSGSAPIKTKDKAMKAIGKYLTRVKMIAMLITEYTYGVRGSDKAVPKRDRLFEPTDVLDMCGYIAVMDDALDGDRICESAAKTVLSSFNHIDIHYTYTLSPTGDENGGENNEIDMEVDSDEDDDDLEEGNVEQDENEPRFNTIL